MRNKNDPTRLSHWFPLIEAAGLPVPATVILPQLSAADDLALFTHVAGEGCWPGFGAFVERIAAAAAPFGFPFFMRTDYTSGKHDWVDTCFVADRARLGEQVRQLAEFSLMADFEGLPIDRWVVREFLTTAPLFRAFNGMPINREFRVFVRDGVIEHRQPYWPPDAIDGHGPDKPEWRALLSMDSVLSTDERAVIDGLAIQANRAVPGFWSVDCLSVPARGWVITDMALGDDSYRWDDMP